MPLKKMGSEFESPRDCAKRILRSEGGIKDAGGFLYLSGMESVKTYRLGSLSQTGLTHTNPSCRCFRERNPWGFAEME